MKILLGLILCLFLVGCEKEDHVEFYIYNDQGEIVKSFIFKQFMSGYMTSDGDIVTFWSDDGSHFKYQLAPGWTVEKRTIMKKY